MDETLSQRLRDAGYKLTPARKAVLQAISQGPSHLKPSEIWRQGRALYPALGRATVYRTFEILTQMGILRPITLGNSVSYIRVQGGHHHLVCSRCGAVIDFDECVTQELAQLLQEQLGWEIHSHLLEFYGRCQACQGASSD